MQTRRTFLGLIAAAGAVSANACEEEPGPGEVLAMAARRQVGVTLGYDSRYRRLPYPAGDVDRRTGVCTDVVVRAARDAWGLDLQQLVHEDMVRNFGAYPRRWGLTRPNPSIDHRRVPNLETYLTRIGALVWSANPKVRRGGADFPEYLEVGDIVTFRGLWTGGPHIAIVSADQPLISIVQNHGAGAREDLLAQLWLDRAHMHFRWRP